MRNMSVLPDGDPVKPTAPKVLSSMRVEATERPTIITYLQYSPSWSMKTCHAPGGSYPCAPRAEGVGRPQEVDGTRHTCMSLYRALRADAVIRGEEVGLPANKLCMWEDLDAAGTPRRRSLAG